MSSQQEARNHIAEIWTDYANDSKRGNRALEGSLLTVQKGFSREGHYLYEFIQNADDAGATTLRVELQQGQAMVFNDGGAFSSSDVDALCDVGHSAKSPEKYIGHMGVGFKSVFLISDNAEVHSGDYHFAFRKTQEEPDFPWQVAPIRVDAGSVESPWRTKFIIKLKDPVVAKRLSEEMQPESLNSRILLFLRSIRRLELVDLHEGRERVITCDPMGQELYRIRETSDQDTFEETWLLFHSGPVPVPDEIRADPFTQNWNRDVASHRAVTIAFRIGADGDLVSVPGTIHMGVFSYLPLREESTRLNFLVHSDFLTTIGRTRIQDEAPWNQWLAKKVLDLIKETTSQLLADGQLRKKALEVLWPARGEGNDFFAIHVERGLMDFLRGDVELPAYDGALVQPSEAIYIEDGDMWDVVGATRLERIYGRKPVNQDIRVPFISDNSYLVYPAPSLFGNSNHPGFVSTDEGEACLRDRAEQKDIDFFKLLYKKMSSLTWTARTYRGAPFAGAAIVLTEEGSIAKPGEARFKTQEIPEQVLEKLQLVDPELADDPASRKFLEMMGITEPSPDDVNRAIAERVVPQARDIWPFLTAKIKLDWLQSFKDLIEQGAIDAGALKDFVTLPSKKSPEWLPPGGLLFPSEYSPEHNIEPLIKAGLLQDSSIVFVDPDIGGGSENRESWKNFLEQLGVGGLATERNRLNGWTAQVGVRLAKYYETKSGRGEIHEVTEAERGVDDLGYDLKTRQEGQPTGTYERFIEAKGTRGSGNFELKPGSLKQIFGAGQEQFFIYVTTEALSSPRLNIIKAVELSPELLFGVGDLQLQLEKMPVSESISLENIL